MPIKIPQGLPAGQVLENENIFVMDHIRAEHQDIRPLKIAVLNLMPTKEATETQLIRLLSNTSLQIDLTLLSTATYTPKNTSAEHMSAFYKSFYDVKDEKFDGLIITGAPVEDMAFEEVTYWPEISEILEWSKTHVFSTMNICWAAQAALYYFYGIPKYPLDKKMFGVFPHTVRLPRHPLVRGFDQEFLAPHSRHTEVLSSDIKKIPELMLLSESPMAGAYLAVTSDCRRVFVTGHCEYDYDTLSKEYFRDVNKGLPIEKPFNYFPSDDPTKIPLNRWRSHANLLFSNWLNYCIYQPTPFDLNDIK